MKRFEYLDSIVQTIGLLTPRQLIEIFPIEKKYDGDKYQTKDYFYTINEIKQIGLDNLIGSKAFNLLWDYRNNDISHFLVETTTTMNLANMYTGGQDALNYIFNGMTEKEEIEKPQLPNYLQIIK